MKKFYCGALVSLAIASLGAVSLGAMSLISQTQAAVDGALRELALEQIPAVGGPLGAPTTFKVTKKTIERLEKLMNDGDTVTVSSDGRLTIRAADAR